jgi:phenylalanyl-tRNA synthetase beta chain
MGGEDSMITDEADTVLLESANFCGINVRKTAKKLGMRTDSSAKFEKRLDPVMALTAVNRAAELIEQIGAGEAVKGVVDCYPNQRHPWTVSYNTAGINSLLGSNLSDSEVEAILARLEISAKNGTANVPTFRPDITSQADLAEEIARLYGYDNIPATLAGSSNIGKKNPIQLKHARIKEAMRALGFNEALTLSYESPSVFDRLKLPENSNLRRAAVIRNPMGDEFSIMRTTTIPTMLTSLSTNYSRRNETAMLYEIARIYLPDSVPMDKLPVELNILTVGMYGNKDFYDIKGAAEYVFDALGIDNILFTANILPVEYPHDMALPFLHPGRMAYIYVNGAFAGFAGEIHPLVAEDYEIGDKTYVCALYLDYLLKHGAEPVYRPLPRFPAMKRDIAVVADVNHSVGDILAAIRNAGGENLEDAAFFDEYKGAGIETGHRSLAFSMHFRHSERTLTDAETTEAVQNVLNELKNKFGASLRL